LPDMENWELIEQLTSSGLYGNIPLIVLSCIDKKETLQKVKDLGIKHHFMKPFNPVDLLKVVDNIISHGIKFQESPLTIV